MHGPGGFVTLSRPNKQLVVTFPVVSLSFFVTVMES